MPHATRGGHLVAWRWLPLLAAMAGVILAGSAAKAGPRANLPSVDSVLLRLLQAGRGVNMRGVQVVMITPPQGPARTATKRVIRTADGRNLTVSLAPAAERGSVTLDDGNWKKSYDPRTRTITVTRAMPRARSKHDSARLVRLIRRNYRVAVEAREPIAGRSCYRLSLVPRSSISHPIKIWMDAATGTVLCHQENDWRGNTVGLILYSSVEFPRHLRASASSYRFSSRARRVNISRSPVLWNLGDLRKRMGHDLWLPLAMPGGYEFDNCELVSLDGLPTACLHYTDGVSNITICESRAIERRPLGFRMMRASFHPLGDVLVACAYGSMDFMVIGHGEVNGLALVARALDLERERACLASLARAFHVDRAALARARDTGVGMDALACLLETARRARRPLHTLLARYLDTWDWRGVATQLRTDPSQIVQAVQRLEAR